MAEVLEGIGCVKAKGNARVMLYGEHKRSKKRLKAAAVDVPKSTTGTST